MKLEKLITEFADATGIANPVAIEGVWKFAADDHVFGITEDDLGSEAWIFGEIPAPSPERADAFRKAALEANFFMRGTGGAVLSINPESGAYTLMKSMPLATATPEDFFALVEKFVNTLATWKGISTATQEAAASEAARAPSEEVPSKLESEKIKGTDEDAMTLFSNMLRV